jgi:hypothetical protein
MGQLSFWLNPLPRKGFFRVRRFGRLTARVYHERFGLMQSDMLSLNYLRRFFPAAAFLGGFAWDTLTIGQRVRAVDLWTLGAFLIGACVLSLWLAHRASKKRSAPSVNADQNDAKGRLVGLAWQAPYLLLQFFFGSIFSALFILYFKSSGHLGTWLTTLVLGLLLVGNEFAGKSYRRHFTLIWALLALNAILLFNFALPHALGSLNPTWFYVSTAAGIGLAHGVRQLAPGRPGRIRPSWALAGVLVLAWMLDMIAPVPLVKQDLAVGHGFVREEDRFLLMVEPASAWQFWRSQSPTVKVAEGERLYGVSAVFAPLGVTALLEHRWEVREGGGWRLVYRNIFQSTGGRERGFRGYSWVLNPQPGEWRLIVATQDGRTIGTQQLTVERGVADPEIARMREF